MIAVWWILLGVAALDQGLASIGPRFFRREHRARAGAYVCVACWLGWGARTGGRLRSMPVRFRRTGCSGCCAPRTGASTGVRDDVRDYVLDALGSFSSLISPVNQTVSLFLEVSVADRIRYSGSRQQKGP